MKLPRQRKQERYVPAVTLLNENYSNPALKEGSEASILKSMYLLSDGRSAESGDPQASQMHVQLRGCVSILREGPDTRESLSTFFEVDRHFIVLAALKALADEGRIPRQQVGAAITRYGIDVSKIDPAAV